MNHPLQCQCGTIKGHVIRPGRGRVESTPVSNLVAMLGLMKSVIGARLRGAYKRNPFFSTETGAPIARPRELTKAERERVTNAA